MGDDKISIVVFIGLSAIEVNPGNSEAVEPIQSQM